jgi:hypothetical protein
MAHKDWKKVKGKNIKLLRCRIASTLLLVGIGIPYLRHIEKKDEEKGNKLKLSSLCQVCVRRRV